MASDNFPLDRGHSQPPSYFELTYKNHSMASRDHSRHLYLVWRCHGEFRGESCFYTELFSSQASTVEDHFRQFHPMAPFICFSQQVIDMDTREHRRRMFREQVQFHLEWITSQKKHFIPQKAEHFHSRTNSGTQSDIDPGENNLTNTN